MMDNIIQCLDSNDNIVGIRNNPKESGLPWWKDLKGINETGNDSSTSSFYLTLASYKVPLYSTN